MRRLGAPIALVLLLSAMGGCGEDGTDPVVCTGTAGCMEQGRCTPEGERCVAATDADCQERSEVCSRFGRCTPQGEAGCVATTDAGCQASLWCGIYGGCHAREGRCLALGDEDCEASSGCKQYGWCTVNARGECVQIVP
jgi:hypothetical protein